jgi:glutamine synthetase
MGSPNVRYQAIQAIAATKHKLDYIDFKKTPVKDLFGVNVFSESVQRQRLPKPIFKALQKTIKHGAPLDPAIADTVAAAMKDWAIEFGATHYTHLFQPMTGITAEKHDSFLAPDGGGGALPEFSGKELIKGEPTPAVFPAAACAQRLKRGATPPGTPPAPLTSWSIPTAPRWSSPPPS